tara:strand:- start:1879 stop:3336 length:1458 start_codon:yes stop_codon:yes gene_type:complete
MITEEFYTNVELYRRGLFEEIEYHDESTNELITLHSKQVKALRYLVDDTVTYVGFGGAARGGKSVLISLAVILECYCYPKTRYLVGRKNLTMLFQTTWKTLLKMLNNFGFVIDKDYSYNSARKELTFHEVGSVIMAKNLELKPSDKEATEFGSLEITKAFIDQSEHVNVKIIEKVGERVGTWMNYNYDIKGKVFEAFNPAKTHVSRRYWKPYKAKKEKNTRKFVRSLPTDNPGEEAIRWVKEKEVEFRDGTMSLTEYQKQVKGNFDYDDDPTVLCKHEDILAAFKNTHVPLTGAMYLTADIARLGSDKAVILVWNGWTVVDYKVYALSKLTEIQETINLFRYKYQIAAHHCIADQDGLGSGVVDNCGIVGFVNNAVPFPEMTGQTYSKPQYNHLQSQCGYKLTERINKHQINITADFSEIEQDEIIEEIGQLKTFKIELDGKKHLLPKAKIQENIGRSPDFRDAFLMRSYFDVFTGEIDLEVFVN